MNLSDIFIFTSESKKRNSIEQIEKKKVKRKKHRHRDHRDHRESFSSHLMNLFRPFINPNKNDDVPHCYNRVRYIRDSCKIFSDLWKNEKDFLNKSVDNDVSKVFKEFRQSEIGRNYRTCETNSISILNQTIDDLIEIHEFIDSKRKESFEQIKKLIEFARDKQNQIRQTMTDLRENYEKSQRKLEIADANLRKFQSRSDRLTIGNFEEKSRELEDLRYECEMNRTLSRDQYSAEIYQFASEEFLISKHLFSQYLFEQNSFYKTICEYLSSKMPEIEYRLNREEFVPVIGLDLIKHCSTRENHQFIAYPIEICVHLLENHLREEGIFRQAPSMIKFKKFLAQLNLQFIDKTTTIEELYLDVHVPASALKHYLRELPDSLLTNQLFQQWNQIASINDEQSRFHRIKDLLDQLPRIHFLNLRYLVRFLSRVVQYSSENRMTSNNLAICIGNSILFSKDQQQQNPSSLSMNYTNGSIILEMLINHHEEYFPFQSSSTTNSNLRIPPDLIPTEFHSKSRSNSNENILDNSSSSSNPIQPSPLTRRKGKAPPPPPSSSSSGVVSSPTPTPSPSTSTEILPSNDSSIPPSSTSKNVILENSSEDLKMNEDFSKDQSKKNLFQRFSTVKTSLSSSINDRIHRRTLSGGWNTNDRPVHPPPLPPTTTTTTPTVKMKQRPSTSTMIDEEIVDKDREDFNRSTSIEEKKDETSDESVNVGKVIAELNHRMANNNNKNSPFHRSQTSSTTTTTNNRRYSSSFRNQIHQSSPGETTDF